MGAWKIAAVLSIIEQKIAYLVRHIVSHNPSHKSSPYPSN
jgi:hypothetical protein